MEPFLAEVIIFNAKSDAAEAKSDDPGAFAQRDDGAADRGHKEWINLISVSQPLHRPGGTDGAADNDTSWIQPLSLSHSLDGPVNGSDIKVEKQVDSTSDPLAQIGTEVYIDDLIIG